MSFRTSSRDFSTKGASVPGILPGMQGPPKLDGSAVEPHALPVRALLVVASAALLWLALPPVGFAPFALVALAPLLVALQGLSPLQGLRLGFVFGFLSAAANAHWF